MRAVTRSRSSRALLRLLAGAAALLALAAIVGLAIEHTAVSRLDEAAARRIVGVLDGPAALVDALDGAAFVNYVVLVALGLVLGVVRGRDPRSVLALVGGAGLLAWGLTRAIWAIWDRARPEEVLGTDTVRVWAHVPSYPSGHVAVTVAMVAGIAVLHPLARVLWGYAAAIAVTRLLFGAHFPTDVLAGIALGYASFLLVRVVLADLGARPPAAERVAVPGDARA